MNMTDTDPATRKLVDELVEYTSREISAWKADSTSAVNRNAVQIGKRLDRLETTPEGRAALVALMKHHLAEVRLRSARRVLAWAPERAIPVLGNLVATWRPSNPRDGYVPVAFDAAVSLYEHLGIRSYNRDDLVEPLARYGVELKRRDEGG